MTVFSVNLSGGGPWGIRLIGGHSDPLLIARIRKRSKAEDAGLQENDELVSINGQPCSSMSHATAMAMLENSSHITLDVSRSGGGNVISAAVPSLGSVPTSTQGERPRTSSVTLQLQTPPAGGMMNGDVYHDAQQYLTDDGATRTVNTSTSTQQFGSTTITKVQREVNTNWGPRIEQVPSQAPAPQGLSPARSPRGSSPYQVPSPRQMPSPGPPAYQAPSPRPAPSPRQFSPAPPEQYQPQQYQPPPQQYQPPPQQYQPPPQQYQLPKQQYQPPQQTPQSYQPQQQPVPFKNPRKITDTVKPNVWQPGGGSAAVAPTVSAQQQPVTFGAEIPPPEKPLPSLGPKFNVRKVSDVTKQQPYSTWAPGGQGGPPRVSPRPMTPPRDEPVSSGPAVWQPPRATFKDIVDTGPKNNGLVSPRNELSYEPSPRNQYEDMPDSPIFESDLRYPEHPDTLPNVDINRLIREGSSDDGSRSDTPTRRKKIFADSAFYDDPEHKYPTIEEQIKMARKVAMSLTSPANKRARGHQMFNKRREKSDHWIAGSAFDPEMDIYYNPTPWISRQGPHTWQPSESPTPAFTGIIPPAPPIPTLGSLDPWMAPSYQDYKKEDKKDTALSAEEFERMRLYEKKNLHNTVSPQVCFSLANDLRNAKGKAGKMFAKRRAKADEHVVDESNVKSAGPDPRILAKLMDGKAPPPAKQTDYKDNSSKGLADLITKPAMTPWEAALKSGGNLDPAFSHINQGWGAGTAPAGLGAPVPDKFSGGPAVTQLEQGGGVSKLDCQDFNRRARGWGGAGGGGSSAPSYASSAASPASAAYPANQWPASSGASAPAQWQQAPGAGAAAAPQYGGQQPIGFSDL